ncbi:MAG TPA: hypothetical protein VJN18_29005 [Polyangiaceae bacterium]|nr:hypothetical protein [Polyangiaceae bacterium]
MAGVESALPWLGALALVALLLLLAVYWPLRLDVSARAKGEADGRFVVAGGASLPFVSLAFVWARGMKPELKLFVFGRKWRFRSNTPERIRSVPEPVKEPSNDAWGRMDPLKLLLKLVSERRHLRLRYLVLDLAYGFRDPLLTGRLVGALSALSGVLPRRIEIRQRPRWDFEDGWEVALDGRAFVKPWLVLLETAAYVVRQMVGHERHEDRRHRREFADGRAGHFEERDHRRRAAAGR